MIGSIHRKDNECVLLFNTKDAILYIDDVRFTEQSAEKLHPEDAQYAERKRKGRKLPAYPAYWADSFGENYYSSRLHYENQEPEDEAWMTDSQGVPFIEPDRKVTTQDAAAVKIKQILGEIGVRDE